MMMPNGSFDQAKKRGLPFIEIRSGIKYATIDYDLSSTHFDLSVNGQSALLDIFEDYIRTHWSYKAIRAQYYSVGPSFIFFKVLKEDVESVLKTINQIVKDNLVPIKLRV